MIKALTIWTIYDHPSDFPDCFVARRWIVDTGFAGPTTEVLTADTLHEIRAKILDLEPDLVLLPRTTLDDPKIVECWI